MKKPGSLTWFCFIYYITLRLIPSSFPAFLINYKNGALAVCCISREFTLKTIEMEGNRMYLMPANKDYQPIEVREDDEFLVWGIVTYIVKKEY